MRSQPQSWARKKEVKLKTDRNYLRDHKLQNLRPVGNTAAMAQQAFWLDGNQNRLNDLIDI